MKTFILLINLTFFRNRVMYIHRKGDEAMSNILEDLWYGNIIPMEDSGKKNEHIKKLSTLMSEYRDELVETMSDKQKELLMKYDDAVNAMYAEFEKEAFVCGFKLGCRIISETLDTKN